jgi:hypothetical protein
MMTLATERPVVPCPYCSRNLRAALQLAPIALPTSSTVALNLVATPRPANSVSGLPTSSQTPLRQPFPMLSTPSRKPTTSEGGGLHDLVVGRSPYTPIASRTMILAHHITPSRMEPLHHRPTATEVEGTQHPNVVPTAARQEAARTTFASLKDLPVASSSSPTRHDNTASPSLPPPAQTAVGASFEELRARLVRFQLSHDYRRVEESEVTHDPDRVKVLHTAETDHNRPDYTHRGAHRPSNHRTRRLNPAAGGSLRSSSSQQLVLNETTTSRRSRSRSPPTSTAPPSTEQQGTNNADNSSWCPIM